SGPTRGDTVVTVSGTGLASATAVSFGGTPAPSFSTARYQHRRDYRYAFEVLGIVGTAISLRTLRIPASDNPDAGDRGIGASPTGAANVKASGCPDQQRTCGKPCRPPQDCGRTSA